MATDGVLQRTVTLNFTVEPADFSTYVSNSMLNVPQGENASTVITLTSKYGFNSAVALTPSWRRIAPSSLDITIQSPLTPTPESPASSVLVFSAGTGASTGNYTLDIIAESGSLKHTIGITLQILKSSIKHNATFTATISTTSSIAQAVPPTSMYLLSLLAGAFFVAVVFVNVRRHHKIEKKIRP
jgi:hypothetical protein